MNGYETHTQKYVLTGGPGVGKTTMLDMLAEQGYNIIPEAARKLIKTNQEWHEWANTTEPLDNYPLPWTNFMGFQNQVAELQTTLESRINGRDSFLDRSLVDNIAYMEMANEELPQGYMQQVEDAHYTKVFLLDQLPIYEKDGVRTESQEEAQQLHQKIGEVYERLGYEVIQVPVFEHIPDRLQFILDRIVD